MNRQSCRLAHIALIVCDYDEAIAWLTEKLGFALVALGDGGGAFPQTAPVGAHHQPEQDKRWVLVAPPGAVDNAVSLLLARTAV